MIVLRVASVGRSVGRVDRSRRSRRSVGRVGPSARSRTQQRIPHPDTPARPWLTRRVAAPIRSPAHAHALTTPTPRSRRARADDSAEPNTPPPGPSADRSIPDTTADPTSRHPGEPAAHPASRRSDPLLCSRRADRPAGRCVGRVGRSGTQQRIPHPDTPAIPRLTRRVAAPIRSSAHVDALAALSPRPRRRFHQAAQTATKTLRRPIHPGHNSGSAPNTTADPTPRHPGVRVAHPARLQHERVPR